MKNKLIRWYLYGALVSSIAGFLFGYFRYWFGFFVLIQGMIAGIFIPKIAGGLAKVKITKNEIRSIKTSRIAIVMLFTFIFSQIAGFGLAQPWFDPFGWLSRITSGKTYESVFGLALTGNVISRHIAIGANKGLWIVLNLLDVAFMFLMMIVSTNTQLERSVYDKKD